MLVQALNDKGKYRLTLIAMLVSCTRFSSLKPEMMPAGKKNISKGVAQGLHSSSHRGMSLPFIILVFLEVYRARLLRKQCRQLRQQGPDPTPANWHISL